MGLLPLLGGCTAAYLVSALLMRHSIMTEKIARRGSRVVSDYAADFLEQVLVSDVAAAPVVVLRADDTCERGPRVDCDRTPRARATGVPGRRRRRPPRRASSRGAICSTAHLPPPPCGAPSERRAAVVVFDDSSLREAADHMVREGVGRLPVVARDDPGRVVGIVTRSDIIAVAWCGGWTASVCASRITASPEGGESPAPAGHDRECQPVRRPFCPGADVARTRWPWPRGRCPCPRAPSRSARPPRRLSVRSDRPRAGAGATRANDEIYVVVVDAFDLLRAGEPQLVYVVRQAYKSTLVADGRLRLRVLA